MVATVSCSPLFETDSTEVDSLFENLFQKRRAKELGKRQQKKNGIN